MSENAFVVGSLVEHPRMKVWGRGKVVKVSPLYVWVFFREAPGREVRQFPASLLLPSSVATDGVLDNLPAFVEKDGVLVLPSERYTLSQGLELLHVLAPEGFGEGGSSKAQKDRDKRRAAHGHWESTLGSGQAQALLEAGDASSLTDLTRRVLAVLASAGTLSSADLGALRQGLEDRDAARAYFGALLGYLAEPAQATFEAYASAAGALFASGSASWPVTTLPLLLAQPGREMLLQPTLTCGAAQRLGFLFPYQATPCWTTYEALLRLSAVHLEALAEHGATDLNDVQLYMAALVARPASARKAAA